MKTVACRFAWAGINYVSRRWSLNHGQLICYRQKSCSIVLERVDRLDEKLSMVKKASRNPSRVRSVSLRFLRHVPFARRVQPRVHKRRGHVRTTHPFVSSSTNLSLLSLRHLSRRWPGAAGNHSRLLPSPRPRRRRRPSNRRVPELIP